MPSVNGKWFHVEKMQSPPRRSTNRESCWHPPCAGASMIEAVMSRWTDEELRELISVAYAFGVANCQTVASPALGDTQ